MTFYPYLHHADPASARGLTSPQVAKAYSFPADVNGSGQHVAIIELGGGFTHADLDKYFAALSLATPHVNAISVQGADNSPGQDADAEVLLDIQVAGAVAPGAVYDIYFCPNTDAGFLAGVTAAIDANPRPAAISISWGGPETSWTAASMQAMDAEFARAVNLGIPIFVAAGDAGANDGTGHPTADFPSSSPHVIACGGTRLVLAADGSRASEVVWDDAANSATGGGFSMVFLRPTWQPASLGQYRAVPDLAFNADPSTGYKVVVNNVWAVIGGTSAAAPMGAALAALLGQKGCVFLGQLGQIGYEHPEALFDVISGNNRGYSAGSGYDPTTGMGVPIGSAYVALMAPAAPLPPPPTPEPPTPVPPTPTPPRPDAADLTFAVAVEAWLNARGIGMTNTAGQVVLGVLRRY